MNVKCPHCEATNNVPDHYAGQAVACSACGKNFTVPALPPSLEPPAPAFGPAATPEPAFALKPPEPVAPPQPDIPAFAAVGPPEPDVYNLAPPSVPSPPPPSPPTTPVSAPVPPPRPAPSTNPVPTPAKTPTPSTPAGPPPTGGYTSACAMYFDPKVIQWFPAAALVLIFFLQFFSWIGFYPAGERVASQGAWYAAFGYADVDPDLKDRFPKLPNDRNVETDIEVKSTASMVFYLIFLFLPTLAVTVALAALPFVNVPLPPQVQQVLPFKWLIVLALNGATLLFLLVPVLMGFQLESAFHEWLDKKPETKAKSDLGTKEQKIHNIERGSEIQKVQRTFWLRAVIFLHVLATAAAGYVYWLERRGPGKPMPKLELQW